MIAAFPGFTNLSLELSEEITSFTNRFEPYSDFNFTSMFSWNTTGIIALSMLNDNLVIKLPDYLEETRPLYSILGNNKIAQSIRTLLTHTSEISIVPEVVIRDMVNNDDGFVIEPSENHFDYLYDLKDLVALKGKSYKDKRNRLNGFINNHQDSVKISHTESINEEKQETALRLMSTWLANGANSADPGLHETKAIERIISNFNRLNLVYTEISIDGKPEGFSINEVLGSGFAIAHFEKTSMKYKGASDYLVHSVAEELLRRSVHTANWEQDLGLTGLRQAKKSYRPSGYLKKYRIRAK